MGARVGLIAVAMVCLAACSSGDDSATSTDSSGTLPLAAGGSRLNGPTDDRSEVAPEDLAPSQRVADTVEPPDLPERCAIADLELWTAQAYVESSSADAVIRVWNTGQAWCEVDVRGSPLIDPVIEPDVWLEPGQWADLVVGQSGAECDEPALVTLAEIVLNGETVVVPTTAVVTCGWRLTALFANRSPVGPCDPVEIELTVVDDTLLVRNGGLLSCTLGRLGGPDPHTPADPEITSLAPGDVVAFLLPGAPTDGCDDDVVPLEFAVVTIEDPPIEPCVVPFGGAGRTYFGAIDGPFDDLSQAPLDIDAALSALDPFGAATG